MSNYYTKFSIAFSLPSQEAQDHAIKLHKKLVELQGDDARSSLPDVFQHEDFDCNFKCKEDGSQSPGLWMHQNDGESCGVESAITFIQHILSKFIPEDQWPLWVVELAWSDDCSSPRLDAFGGGIAHITADKVRQISTREWSNQQNTPIKNQL